MKTNRLKASQSKKLEAYLFILPAFFYVLLVMGYPLLYNAVLSLQNMDVKNLKKGTAVFIGLKNYVELFQNETFRKVVGNTFIFTIFSLIFQFSIGFLFALFFKKDFKLSGPIRGLILIAYMLPMSVTGLLGKNIFMNAGLINDLLARIGITGPEWLTSTTWSMTAVIIMNCWVGIPFNMLLLLSGLSSINQEIYESAMIDGATPRHRFFYITLPLMKNSILATLMLGFIYTFRAFDLMFIMTSGGPLNSTDVLGTYAYQLSFTQFKFSKGAAAAMVLFACLFVVGVIYLNLMRKEDD